MPATTGVEKRKSVDFLTRLLVCDINIAGQANNNSVAITLIYAVSLLQLLLSP